MKNEPASYSVWRVKAVEGRSRSESESEQGVEELDGVDPKPRELPMARVKVR